MLDASLIWKPTPRSGGLYMGGFPHDPNQVCVNDFDLLVICASEKLASLGYPDEADTARAYGCSTLHAPFDDDELTAEAVVEALRAAEAVTGALRRRQKVLVTCNQGRNRSGLVTGLALLRLRPELGGDEVVELIKTRRSAPCGAEALTNSDFRQWLVRAARGAR